MRRSVTILVALLWSGVVFCLPLVLVRLYVQITTRVRPWRELLLVFAWVAMVVFSVGETVLMCVTDDFYDPRKPVENTSSAIVAQKMFGACLLSWTLGGDACRGLLLLIYKDICPRHIFRLTWWFMAATWALMIGGTIGTNFIYAFFICAPKPIRALWTPGENCGWGWYGVFACIGCAGIAILDASVYIIPIIIVRQLRNLTMIQRVGVAAMFAIGFINCAAAFTMFVAIGSFVYLPHHLDFDTIYIMVPYLKAIQLPTAIIIICIPQLRIIGRWRVSRFVNTIKSINHTNMRTMRTGTVMTTTDAVILVDPDVEIAASEAGSKTPSEVRCRNEV